jgi:hypothetical protein
LKTNTIGTFTYICAIVMGFLIAGIAIYMEEKGFWETKNSLIFFAITFVGLIPISYWPWKHIRFKLKSDKA